MAGDAVTGNALRCRSWPAARERPGAPGNEAPSGLIARAPRPNGRGPIEACQPRQRAGRAVSLSQPPFRDLDPSPRRAQGRFRRWDLRWKGPDRSARARRHRACRLVSATSFGNILLRTGEPVGAEWSKRHLLG